MTFVINTLTRCGGLTHWTVTLTLPGGAVRTIDTDAEELNIDFPANPEAARQAILSRLRSAAKEAGAANFAQAKVALEGRTFQI